MRLVVSACLAVMAAVAQPPRPNAPRILSKSEPSYTEEARRATVNTTVLLSFVLGSDGAPRDVRVERPAGFGLDESAVAAVSTWRFEPPADPQSPLLHKRTSVEVHFRQLAQGHEGQTARLNFTLAPGATRPQLVRGRMPANPGDQADARVKIAFSVGPDGKPRDLTVIETDSQHWANDVLDEMKDWLFQPQPALVHGVFELTRSSGRAVPAPPGRGTDPL